MPLFVLAGACANAPSGSTYTLTSEPLPEDRDPGIPLAIVIDYVAVPEEIDRAELVVRVNPSQVRILEAARWSEPLKTQIARVVASDLNQLFRDSLVLTLSQKTDRPTVRIAINVLTFDTTPGAGVVLSVAWSILTPDFAKVLNGKSVVLQRVDGHSYDALVDAQSQALAALSVDMADAIMAAIKKKHPGAGDRTFDANNAGKVSGSMPHLFSRLH